MALGDCTRRCVRLESGGRSRFQEGAPSPTLLSSPRLSQSMTCARVYVGFNRSLSIILVGVGSGASVIPIHGFSSKVSGRFNVAHHSCGRRWIRQSRTYGVQFGDSCLSIVPPSMTRVSCEQPGNAAETALRPRGIQLLRCCDQRYLMFGIVRVCRNVIGGGRDRVWA